MSREFYETRSMFRSYINYTDPYSYEQWLSLPQDHKCAALYVQFFDEIILAWYKVKSFYGSDEEGVETICQYLMKNVPVLEENPKRFNARYIYRVAYNCLYCICHDRLIDKQRFELEISNIAYSGDSEEINMFDYINDNKAEDEFDLSDKATRDRFWKIIDSDEDMKALVEHILNGQRCPFRGKRKEATMEKLRVNLSIFREMYY